MHIGNFTTNLAECWMTIRAKFDGGKQYNRSQRGAWEGRCAGAGLRQNLGPEWGTAVWEKVTGKEANSVFKIYNKSYSKGVENDRKRKATEEVKQRRKAVKYKKTNDDSLKARTDYDRHDDGPGVAEVHQDLPEEYLQNLMVDYYNANVKHSGAKILEVEASTKNQGVADELATNLWMTERRKRITASVCGNIAKRRSTTKVANTVKSLLYPTFRGNIATEWGNHKESEALGAYLALKQQTGSPTITAHKSGLVIHPSHQWIAASPDGLINDPTSNDPEGIVEIKNPYAIRNMNLSEAITQNKDMCLTLKNGSLHLKHTHNYFYQVQATMYCTGRKWCDFVLKTKSDIHVERIFFQPDFWQPVLHRLRAFYFAAILPELAVPRLQQGGIREPTDWLHNPKNWKRRTECF